MPSKGDVHRTEGKMGVKGGKQKREWNGFVFWRVPMVETTPDWVWLTGLEPDGVFVKMGGGKKGRGG